MRVIKLGGSLLSDAEALINCLNTIEQKIKDKVVIVPGGGLFADQVRKAQKQWQFNDKIAHQMAILAMQQMALLFKSIKPDFLIADKLSAIREDSIFIWSPDVQQLNLSAVKASWDITSDSLAAWLANQLKADELILVKSADIPTNINIYQMQQQGLVDKAFDQFTRNSNFTTVLLNKYSFNEYNFT